MTTPTKCCGTCRFFEPVKVNGRRNELGDCTAPVPIAYNAYIPPYVYPSEMNCPCHAPREGEPPTDKET